MQFCNTSTNNNNNNATMKIYANIVANAYPQSRDHKNKHCSLKMIWWCLHTSDSSPFH